jgi:hypothetical protein
MNRFHLNDSIAFQDKLRIDLGLDHDVSTQLGMEGVLYWYSTMDASPKPLELTGEQLIPQPLPQVEFVYATGSVEAEGFRLKRLRGEGEITAVDRGPEGASAGVLTWQGAKKDSYATLTFNVTGSGLWDTMAKVYTYPGAPSVIFYLDGKEAGESIDLNAEVEGWKIFPIGAHKLANREHVITIEVLTEPAAEKQPTIIMDYLRLKLHD